MIDSDDQRWVRILADHASTGVWAREGWPIELDELPISTGLAADICAWQLNYEANRDWDGDYSFDVAGSAREGLAIARRVKAELADWTVMFFDEQAYKRNPDAARGVWEYEIVEAAGG